MRTVHLISGCTINIPYVLAQKSHQQHGVAFMQASICKNKSWLSRYLKVSATSKCYYILTHPPLTTPPNITATITTTMTMVGMTLALPPRWSDSPCCPGTNHGPARTFHANIEPSLWLPAIQAAMVQLSRGFVSCHVFLVDFVGSPSFWNITITITLIRANWSWSYQQKTYSRCFTAADV